MHSSVSELRTHDCCLLTPHIQRAALECHSSNSVSTCPRHTTVTAPLIGDCISYNPVFIIEACHMLTILKGALSE
eukprot:423625-Amphidinium_carterae.4